MSQKLPKNWRSLIEWKYEKSRHSFEFILKFKSHKKTKDFQTEIGRLSIDDVPPYFVSNVHLDEHFKGLGLGLQLYKRAVKKLGKLSTKYYRASEEAQKVWKKLASMYRSRKRFFTGTLTVYRDN